LINREDALTPGNCVMNFFIAFSWRHGANP
jgi:hypothetical protein